MSDVVVDCVMVRGTIDVHSFAMKNSSSENEQSDNTQGVAKISMCHVYAKMLRGLVVKT